MVLGELCTAALIMIIIVSVSTLVQLEICKLTTLFYIVGITGDIRVHRSFFFENLYMLACNEDICIKLCKNRESITAE